MQWKTKRGARTINYDSACDGGENWNGGDFDFAVARDFDDPDHRRMRDCGSPKTSHRPSAYMSLRASITTPHRMDYSLPRPQHQNAPASAGCFHSGGTFQ